MSLTNLAKVESPALRADQISLEVELAKPRAENGTDYYEILRVGPQADEETIERVYRTLADRFHPDNPGTGDSETFLRLAEAYDTLSNPASRAKYDAWRRQNPGSTRFGLRGREFFDGVRGGQNRRLAILCLLYRRRISTHESPGLSILDLEHLTGCTREEVTSALWYLCEKKWVNVGESTAYSVTSDGFEVVESELENRMEFRSLATLCYYTLPAETKDPAQAEQRFWKDTLPLYLEPAKTIEGGALSDHYEVLGIGPQADEEVIERVYGTLAGRFHPDTPGTGNAEAFLRIREAYETLSDQSRRDQYDALRQQSKDSARFHLRGREFFDGIKGEQLRRLAVLCLLYRQALSESPGLTVLDLEELTGCTREELSSALWYLREKKWARSGEYSEYSITAAGFDIVESAAQPAAQIRQNISPYSPAMNTVALGEPSSHWIEQAEKSPADGEVAKAMIPLEEVSDAATQAARVEAGGFDPEEVTSWAWLYPTEGADVEAEASTENSITPAPGIKIVEAVEDKPVAPSPVEAAPQPAAAAEKRVILSMGGKGGVGKTSVMTGLAEWFGENRIPVTLLDLDIENKAIGSLAHFFAGRVPKINIHTPAGLDAFVDNLGEDAPVILADMGAGSGQVTHDWFDKMYPDVAEVGVVFTAVGVVTSDPASVESVLNWATALQDRVSYVIVRNHLTEHPDFSYWDENEQAQQFRERFKPAILKLDYRLADLENAVRNHGVTLGQVAERKTSAPELQKASLVMRAQSYRRRMFAEFDRVKELLLP